MALTEASQLRALTRFRRNNLTDAEQAQAANGLFRFFSAHKGIAEADVIALYFANDGEIQTQLLIEYCWQQGKQVVIPVIHPVSAGHLLFLRLLPSSSLLINRYGIIEPRLDVRDVVALDKIDVFCTPLVAFDATGNRIGMGGGYYDRTFALAQSQQALRIGLAHDCQQVEQINTRPWDISLQHILTPSRHWVFAQNQDRPHP